MAHSRAVTVFFAAIACTTLPARAAGQRVLDYPPSRLAHGATRLPRLELGGTVRVRVPWRPSEVALAGGFAAALLVDAAQTRRLARSGWRDWRETNPILGPRPSVGRVNTYTAVVGLAVLGVAAAAPKRARPGILGVALAVEVYTLAAMSRAGVAITF
jgi:hypothetical protein